MNDQAHSADRHGKKKLSITYRLFESGKLLFPDILGSKCGHSWGPRAILGAQMTGSHESKFWAVPTILLCFNLQTAHVVKTISHVTQAISSSEVNVCLLLFRPQQELTCSKEKQGSSACFRFTPLWLGNNMALMLSRGS
jgi:hypothetical protein